MHEVTARQQGRAEAREERNALAEATQHGFLKYFVARREAQDQRRREESWAKGLPGANQAQTDHATRMHEIKVRQQARAQARKEKKALAEATRHGFLKYFEARRAAQEQRRRERSWVKGLPGADRAQADHANRMHEIEGRRQARTQGRKEMKALDEATQHGFLKYFAARRETQEQRRRERSWANGLPGANQAQASHEASQKEREARRQSRSEARKQWSEEAQSGKA